ncbi:MAG: hypothetical protein JST59_01735 [Actinobacteria bacterium]|nr:hypothetical protein [Actinomycetota bacterium]
MLSNVVRRGFASFNILNSIKNFKNALKAPIKHIKATTEAGGQNFSPQTNTTEEAFDEVSQEWQVIGLAMVDICG